MPNVDLNGIAYLCSASRIVATELVDDELNNNTKLSLLASGAMRVAKAMGTSDSKRAWKAVAYVEWTVLEEAVRLWSTKRGGKFE